MNHKEIIEETVEDAAAYGQINFDFLVELERWEGKTAIVKFRNKDAARTKCSRAKIKVCGQMKEGHILEVTYMDGRHMRHGSLNFAGEKQWIGPSGHALCALLYA